MIWRSEMMTLKERYYWLRFYWILVRQGPSDWAERKADYYINFARKYNISLRQILKDFKS